MSNKCIVLSRVSTIRQDLVQQREAVIKKAKSEGYNDIIVIEDKESGVKLKEEDRLGLNKLKSTIINDKDIKCVFVYEVSRIGRRPDVNYSIRNFLQEHHVQLRVVDPDITLFNDDFTINESANLIFSIFNSMAENEGWLRKERTMRGRMRAVSQNRFIGGGILFGYRKGENNVIEIDPEKAEYVRKMFNDYANGTKSAFDIGEEMFEMGYLKGVTISNCCIVVAKYLKNIRYTGKSPEGKYQYPRIVDDEVFNKANELLSSKKKVAFKSHKHEGLLRGLVRDKLTGNLMIVKQGGYEIYKKYIDGRPSHFINIRMDFLDDKVWKVLCDKPQIKPFIHDMTSPDTEALISVTRTKLDATRAKITSLNGQIEKINRRVISDRMDEKLGDIEIDKRREEIELLENNIIIWQNELDNLKVSKIFKETVGEMYKENYEWRDEKDIKKKKIIVNYYIKDILCERGKADIVWYDNTVESFTYNIHKKIFEKVS